MDDNLNDQLIPQNRSLLFPRGKYGELSVCCLDEPGTLCRLALALAGLYDPTDSGGAAMEEPAMEEPIPSFLFYRAAVKPDKQVLFSGLARLESPSNRQFGKFIHSVAFRSRSAQKRQTNGIMDLLEAATRDLCMTTEDAAQPQRALPPTGCPIMLHRCPISLLKEPRRNDSEPTFLKRVQSASGAFLRTFDKEPDRGPVSGVKPPGTVFSFSVSAKGADIPGGLGLVVWELLRMPREGPRRLRNAGNAERPANDPVLDLSHVANYPCYDSVFNVKTFGVVGRTTEIPGMGANRKKLFEDGLLSRVELKPSPRASKAQQTKLERYAESLLSHLGEARYKKDAKDAGGFVIEKIE